MSEQEIEMLRHCVGADTKEPGLRNRYCTNSNDEVALGLVEKGLMAGPKYEGNFGLGMGLFFATPKAFKLLGIKEKE